MGQTTKTDSTSIYVTQPVQTTMTVLAADTSRYIDIYTTRPANDYIVSLTNVNVSPQFSFHPGYSVYNSSGASLWSVRSLFNILPPNSGIVDANGNTVYAYVRLFMDFNIGTASSYGLAGTWNVNCWFTNLPLSTS